MASRKGKPKRPPPSAGVADMELTREVALTAAQLAASRRTDSSPPIDDLAQTFEAPSAPRLLILDAAGRLVTKKPFGAITEEEIATAANVDDDVFRACFADRTTLLRALVERFSALTTIDADEAARVAASEGANAHGIVIAAARTVFDSIVENAALVRAAHTSGDDAIVEELRLGGSRIASRVTSRIEPVRNDDSPDDRTVAFTLLLATSLGRSAVLVGGGTGSVDFDRAELQARLEAAIAAYLRG